MNEFTGLRAAKLRGQPRGGKQTRVREHVTSEEEDGGTVVWDSAVFKWTLRLCPSVQQPFLHSSRSSRPTFWAVGTPMPVLQTSKTESF